MNNKTFVWLMTLEWTTIEHLKTEKKKQEQINWKKIAIWPIQMWSRIVKVFEWLNDGRSHMIYR